MLKDNYCILLTGTIQPLKVFSLGRIDVETREKDYYNAICQWLKKGVPVVFCESSGYASERISALGKAHTHFEFLQYKDETDLSEKGKGYGEYLVMQHAFAHSKFIGEAEFIVKVTGRLFVKNFDRLLKSIGSKEFDVASALELTLKWADSRLFIFRRSFYTENFVPFGGSINDKQRFVFERALACGIHDALSKNKTWEPLPFFPVYKGYSGTFNYRYRLFSYDSIRKSIRFYFFNRLVR